MGKAPKNDTRNKGAHCKNAPSGILARASGFYTNTLCGCGGGVDQRSVINCTVPQTSNKLPRNSNLGSSKETENNLDIQDLMRMLAAKKGGGAKVDVDSEGNLVWRKSTVVEASYGGGVGRIGRIDEDKPCCFSEVDVNNFLYSRCGSNNAIIRRNVGY